VVLDAHRDQLGRPQRGDGDGPGVVGVVLLRPSRAQQPHPRRQGRGDVHHLLAGGEELLREQVAEPAGGLDGPGPFPAIEALGPLQQLRHLGAGRVHQSFVEHPLTAVDRDRGVGPLVGSMPIITIAVLRSRGSDRGVHS
jgi:hypothetical protein